VSFSDADREELLSFYFALSGSDVEWAAFETAFWDASAQRLMQALGAYGFLWQKLGLEEFVAHIPSGLDNLRRAAGRSPRLPLLRELAERCSSAYARER
jgi:aminoglycoside/choline kinase family phosphotransferase